MEAIHLDTHYYADPKNIQSLSSNQFLGQDKKLQVAAQQFEAMLLRQVLKESLKPMIEGAINLNGTGSNIYQHWLVDTYANALSQTESFGIASTLKQQLIQNTEKSPPEQSD